MILGFILVILAGVSKSIMDVLQFHFSDSKFNTNRLEQYFWNPDLSWMNKYKDFEAMGKVPRFFGSTTFLVWTTDAWHLFQMIKNVTLISGMLLIGFNAGNWKMLILFGGIGYILYTTIFELFYSKIFKK
tara:strand:- start:2449 stop:2838 length:390 start_codon:yes stop_codon:yes gene_type:complete